jgi:hypothetical protein
MVLCKHRAEKEIRFWHSLFLISTVSVLGKRGWLRPSKDNTNNTAVKFKQFLPMNFNGMMKKFFRQHRLRVIIVRCVGVIAMTAEARDRRLAGERMEKDIGE